MSTIYAASNPKLELTSVAMTFVVAIVLGFALGASTNRVQLPEGQSETVMEHDDWHGNVKRSHHN